MRKAGQYCVQIYGDFFGKLNGAGMLQLVSEDIQDFYELVSVDQYLEDYGWIMRWIMELQYLCRRL